MNKIKPVLQHKYLKNIFILTHLIFILSLFLSHAYANTQTIQNEELVQKSEAILTLFKMQKKVKKGDFKFSAIFNENAQTVSFNYQQAGSENSNIAKVIYLEGAKREIILHNNVVSYLNAENIPFGVKSSFIEEVFPAIIYADYQKLADNYEFVTLGKARTANRNCQLVRIISKTHDLFNYVIWIDDESALPLRIDLLDEKSQIIKQLKVISLDFSFNKQAFIESIKQHQNPILFEQKNAQIKEISWQLNWLPVGFKEIKKYSTQHEQIHIETKIFSDGVFTFSISLSNIANKAQTHLFAQSDRSIYSTHKKNKNIVIIGDLPIETLKKIVEHTQI